MSGVASENPPTTAPLPPSSNDGTRRGRAWAAALPRRAAGFALVALSVLPIYHVLDPDVTGTAGDHTLTRVDTIRALTWSGTLLALIPFVLGLGVDWDRHLARPLRRAGRWLCDLPTTRFALGLGALAFVLSAAFGWFVLDGKPNLIDAMAQLVQARYLAAGHLAGPTGLAAFYAFPNTVLTDAGWVSQYPPLHPLLLAAGMRLGAVVLVGPLFLGITAALTALTADRLFPGSPAARLGAAFAAVSPFLVAHAGAFMNHTTAAAFTGATIYCVVRARDGGLRWAAFGGVLASLALALRPLSAIAMIGAVGVVAWGAAARLRGWGWFARALGIAALAALPLTLLQLAYNAHFFGGPTTFGYLAAYGPSHRLGFHLDPWGNRYGLLQAFGYTSSDLTLLSVNLLETPLPLVALVGVWLLFVRRLGDGERVVAAWAIAPVVTNFFYWHHGIFMGPRMLNEAAPAWSLLVALALAGLVVRTPARVALAGRGYAPRSAAALTLAVALGAGLIFMAPRRLLSYGGDYLASLRIEPPAPPAPAMVFVHGAWSARIGSRLMAAGMRSDTLETALRQNSTCDLARFADAYVAGSVMLPPLDVEPRANRLPPSLEIAPDDYIRFHPGEQLSADCVSQIRSDEGGVLEVVPFLWQAQLPGLGEGGVLFLRDLGSAGNRAALERWPERTPYVLAPPLPGEPPRLLPYAAGMDAVWARRPAATGTIR